MRISWLSILAAFLLLAVPTALLAQPTISVINPNAGPTAGGQTVNITGTGFTTGGTVNDVTFGGVSGTNLVVNSDTDLDVDTPAGTAGQVDVIVVNPGTGSVTATNGYEYAAAPTITNVNPNAGPTAGGTTVTLSAT